MNELSTFLPSLSVCIYFIHFTDYQRVRSGSALQRLKKQLLNYVSSIQTIWTKVLGHLHITPKGAALP